MKEVVAIMVPESAVKLFLTKVRALQSADKLPDALEIGKEIFGEPAFLDTAAVVEECKTRGFLSQHYTRVAISPAGETFLDS